MGTRVRQAPGLTASASKQRSDTTRQAAETIGLQAARRLSAILVVLLAAASAAGLWIDSLYQDPESVARCSAATTW